MKSVSAALPRALQEGAEDEGGDAPRAPRAAVDREHLHAHGTGGKALKVLPQK